MAVERSIDPRSGDHVYTVTDAIGIYMNVEVTKNRGITHLVLVEGEGEDRKVIGEAAVETVDILKAIHLA